MQPPPNEAANWALVQVEQVAGSKQVVGAAKNGRVVGTRGVGVAGPALVYANRAGALTKLCTLDSAELSELSEREWDKYEKEQPVDELYRDAPWVRAGLDDVDVLV